MNRSKILHFLLAVAILPLSSRGKITTSNFGIVLVGIENRSKDYFSSSAKIALTLTLTLIQTPTEWKCYFASGGKIDTSFSFLPHSHILSFNNLPISMPMGQACRFLQIFGGSNLITRAFLAKSYEFCLHCLYILGFVCVVRTSQQHIWSSFFIFIFWWYAV